MTAKTERPPTRAVGLPIQTMALGMGSERVGERSGGISVGFGVSDLQIDSR
jgi:hypothetical protein